MATDDEDFLIVAALEFDVSRCGYAFSFVNRQEKIWFNKNWAEVLGFQVNIFGFHQKLSKGYLSFLGHKPSWVIP